MKRTKKESKEEDVEDGEIIESGDEEEEEENPEENSKNKRFDGVAVTKQELLDSADKDGCIIKVPVTDDDDAAA